MIGGDYKPLSLFKRSLTAVLNYVYRWILISSVNSWLQFSSLCTYPSQYVDSHEQAHNFLQDAEKTKLLNCSHHLSAGTKAVLNSSFKSAPGKSAEVSILFNNMQPPLSLTSGCGCCGHPMYTLWSL